MEGKEEEEKEEEEEKSNFQKHRGTRSQRGPQKKSCDIVEEIIGTITFYKPTFVRKESSNLQQITVTLITQICPIFS